METMKGMPASGVYAIIATPFDSAEQLDMPSLERQIHFHRNAGTRAVVVLAVMGEGAKVSEEERHDVMSTAIQSAQGQLDVIVGITAPSVYLVRRWADQAAKLGARGVLLSPSNGISASQIPALYEKAAQSKLPIVLQDYPPASGVTLTAETIAEVVEQVPAIFAIKNEAPPTGPRTRALLAQCRRPVTILGGLGALNLLDELDAGATGTMTGLAFPEILVGICNAYAAGNRNRAKQLYEAFLPWLVFESMPGVSLAIRKQWLNWRGILSDATLRAPAPSLDESTRNRARELFEAFAEKAAAMNLQPAPKSLSPLS